MVQVVFCERLLRPISCDCLQENEGCLAKKDAGAIREYWIEGCRAKDTGVIEVWCNDVEQSTFVPQVLAEKLECVC